MSRWDPDARGRLAQAAMDLYAERGFEQTTVADIAERAGLTERTFFRHYADKREVLFAGSAALQDHLVGAVVDAPPDAPPMAAVVAAIEHAGAVYFDERRAHARRRQALVEASAELHERELIKMARLGEALGQALRTRGVEAPTADLVAEAGIAVFKVAFVRWIGGPDDMTFAQVVARTASELGAVTAAR